TLALAMPAETVPAKTVPAKTVPAKTVPAKTGPAKTAPAETGASGSSPSFLRKAATMEAAGWRNLFGLITRRRHVPAGAEAFTYRGPIMSILIVFIAVSAIEVVAVDLIVHRWPIPRIVALVI